MTLITAGAVLSLFPTISLCKDLIVGPSVVEITKKFNDVFPYDNFNRNVTVPMWGTNLLNGKDKSASQEVLDTIANASFIVYDSEFYEVHIYLITAPRQKFLANRSSSATWYLGTFRGEADRGNFHLP